MAFSNRKKRKFTGPAKIDNMMSYALNRHGIKKQVTAAMITVRVNELIKEFLAPHISKDVHAISYAKEVILVACRHPAAVYEAQAIHDPVKKTIEAEFPKITISKVNFHINQEPWMPEL